jgi:hypothetical protein
MAVDHVDTGYRVEVAVNSERGERQSGDCPDCRA